MSENYRATRYDLDELSIVNFAGKKIDIRDMFATLDITEDMYSPVCYGQVVLADTQDLKQNFPLIGEEKLIMKYRTHEDQDYIQREFYVYAMEDEDEHNQASVNYVLNFCSVELIKNKAITISRAFSQMTPSDIVQAILKNDLGITKPIIIDKSIGVQNYIAPNVAPFEIINEMATRAMVGSDPGSCFLFFENKEGFHFQDLGNLMDDPPLTYKMVNTSYQNDKPADQMQSAQAIGAKKNFNVLDNVNDGSYGSTSYVLDVFRRKSSKVSYDYFDDKQFSSTKRVASQNPNCRIQTSKFEFKNAKDAVKNYMVVSEGNDSNKHMNVAMRKARLNQLGNGIIINVDVPGNSDLTSGKILLLEIPSKSIDDHKQEENDKFMSGRFLITSIRHFFKRREYYCHMELTKDSYENDHEELIADRNEKVNVK